MCKRTFALLLELLLMRISLSSASISAMVGFFVSEHEFSNGKGGDKTYKLALEFASVKRPLEVRTARLHQLTGSAGNARELTEGAKASSGQPGICE